MKVLVINGSPKGKKSNTIKLTDAFIKGMQSAGDVEVQTVTIVEKDIKGCMGCFSCWGATPGRCIIKDDMDAIREQVLWADVVLESYPLYFFGMPGQMKTFTDRMVPFTQSYLGESAEGKTGGFHEMRFGIESKKMILISTCGYTNSKIIYDSLLKEYDCFCGNGNYTFIANPQGELFGIPMFDEITAVRLKKLEEAGAQYVKNAGSIDAKLIDQIGQEMIPSRAFGKILEANWRLAKEKYDAAHPGEND